MSAMLVRLADGLTAPHSQKQQGELYSNFGYGSTNIINGSITITFMRIIVIVNENKLLAFRSGFSTANQINFDLQLSDLQSVR